jgi:PTS system ascorbate-specific IIA component
MSIGVLIISHDGIGASLLQTATDALAGCPLEVELLGASRDCDPDQLFDEARKRLATLDQGDGVLILTDLYGSTPGNIATRLGESERVRIIAGVNLPMLIRIFNYPNLGLDELSKKAVNGGQGGIFVVDKSK